jgi:hypothetical protein
MMLINSIIALGDHRPVSFGKRYLAPNHSQANCLQGPRNWVAKRFSN